jgi:hypothetical protein
MLGLHGPRRWYKGVFVLLLALVDVVATYAIILLLKTKVDEIVADPNGRTYRFLVWIPRVLTLAMHGAFCCDGARVSVCKIHVITSL